MWPFAVDGLHLAFCVNRISSLNLLYSCWLKVPAADRRDYPAATSCEDVIYIMVICGQITLITFFLPLLGSQTPLCRSHTLFLLFCFFHFLIQKHYKYPIKELDNINDFTFKNKLVCHFNVVRWKCRKKYIECLLEVTNRILIGIRTVSEHLDYTSNSCDITLAQWGTTDS